MSKEKLKISLIICAYNEEKYIGDCLAYVQKHADEKFHEILVIDNASTDNTKMIAATYPHVRVITENAKGLTRARQRGYQEATGDVLAYIDADTHMPVGWVEEMIKIFTHNLHASCVSGPYVYYDIPKYQQFLVRVYWFFAMPLYWFVGYMVVGGNFAIRKSVLDQMQGFDTQIEFYGEDTNIARRANAFGKVVFLPSLIMYTSGRRLAKQGIASTFFEYTKNFLSEALLHKPITTKYKDHR